MPSDKTHLDVRTYGFKDSLRLLFPLKSLVIFFMVPKASVALSGNWDSCSIPIKVNDNIKWDQVFEKHTPLSDPIPLDVARSSDAAASDSLLRSACLTRDAASVTCCLGILYSSVSRVRAVM